MSEHNHHDSADMRARRNYQLLERGVLVKLVGDPDTGAWTIEYPKNGVLQPDELSVVITTPWRYDRLVQIERADGCLSDLTLRKMMRQLGHDVPGE